jgi:hypothetical protein
MPRTVKKSLPKTPDQRPLSRLQAERLSMMAQIPAKELVNKSIREIADRHLWEIDPELLLFRRICGRVVKRDPVTGEERPVPFATVHVEDSDCNLLGFFPPDWPWGWFFPLFCNREVIATALTDECGNFCVWIPRFEIDWILHWRLERFCFPDIFIKPNIRDLLENLPIKVEPPIIYRPPLPDPPPFLLKDGGLSLRRAADLVGPQVASRLAAYEASARFGESSGVQQKLLESPAFSQPLPPPLPKAVQEMAERKEFSQFKEMVKPDAGAMSAAMGLKMEARFLEGFDPRHYIGPFLRCRYALVPEWFPIIDVPDVTFRVTQDVDGDGDEETIYAEGFFDVRWDSGPIPDVVLEASEIAVAGLTCGGPEVPCAEPAIVLAGKMPLHNLPGPPPDPYLDVAGYATRPNRPHPSGMLADPPPNPLATSPLAGTFPLMGCNEHGGAVYYRLQYAFQPPGGGGFTSFVPFTGISWWLYRWVGVPGHLETLNVTPDADGWYNILNLADQWLPSHVLLNWPSGSYQNGTYRVKMQLGNAAKAVIHETGEVRMVTDNSSPNNSRFTGLAWRQVGASAWIDLGLVCPVVARPAGADIEFRVDYIATANHLRAFTLSGGGCGGGAPSLVSPLSTAQHWYIGALDNSVANSAVFQLLHTAPQGAYSFTLVVNSRAFNPDDANGLAVDWEFDPLHIYMTTTLPIAVVNA